MRKFFHDDDHACAAGVNPDGSDLYGHPQSLYLTETGDARAIEASDIHQDSLGDCFVLSPLGMIAEEDPYFLRSATGMIKDNGNGTQTVRLYADAVTGKPVTMASTGFKPVFITVNDRFVAGTDNSRLSTDDYYGGQKEIWSQVVEKAVATLYGGGAPITTLAGYSSIANGGYPFLTMETLTGEHATYASPAAETAANLTALLAGHDLITFDTGASTPAGYNLVGDHCYMVAGVTGTGAGAMVQCINPWGFDQPTAIPIGQLSAAFVQADIGGHV